MHSSDAHVVQIQALIKGHLHRQGEHKCQQKSEITIQVVSAETYLAKEFLPRCRCNAWFPGGSAQVQGAGAKNKRGTPAPEREVHGGSYENWGRRAVLWELRLRARIPHRKIFTAELPMSAIVFHRTVNRGTPFNFDDISYHQNGSSNK